MEAISLPIYSSEGKEVDSLKLDQTVFNGQINQRAIYQAVLALRANQHKGLAATKTRGEVSGGGRKPWRQKGTGRARVGSIRSPLWRHGGVVFGPHPRDYSYNLPRKIRNLALKSSLNVKVKENNLIVLENLKLTNNKTKEAAKIFMNLKLKDKKNFPSVLLLAEGFDLNSRRALGNLNFLKLNLARDTNSYEVLAAKKLIITKVGLAELVKRLKQ